MDLRAMLLALRAAWWLPVVGALVGGLGALTFSLLQTPMYTSTTQLFTSTTDTASSYDALVGGQFVQARVSSYARLLGGEELARRVATQLRLDVAPEVISNEITAGVEGDTVLLNVSVTDRSPERARDIARAIGRQFPSLVAELETTGDGASTPIKVTVVDAADLPKEPSAPRTMLNVALGVIGGLLLGGIAAVLRTRLDRTVREADDAAVVAGAPVIGFILKDELLSKGHVIDRSSSSRIAEDYRQLRNNLQFLSVDDPPKVIMVTSAVPSEGKSTVVVNLALALTDAGRKVTILEADLRRPKVTRYLGMIGGAGLTNILVGNADVDDVIQRYGERGLSVIAAGPTPPNPGELLASSQMSRLLDKLRGQNDFVLVDAPPLLPVADSTGLAVLMDGILLSIRYGSTRRDQVEQAAAALQRVNAAPLGCILNIVPAKAEIATAYGYGYSYGYDAGRQPTG